MTKQQQELYDKLLKKVNEFCLGAAAEDVIAAIDNLVDNYESNHTTLCTIATELSEERQKLIAAIDDHRIRMKEWESGHSVDFSKVRFEIQNLLPDPDDIGKRLKALEIIKEKLTPYVEKYRDLGYTIACDMIAIGITQEEYELLKEVLK